MCVHEVGWGWHAWEWMRLFFTFYVTVPVCVSKGKNIPPAKFVQHGQPSFFPSFLTPTRTKETTLVREPAERWRYLRTFVLNFLDILFVPFARMTPILDPGGVHSAAGSCWQENNFCPASGAAGGVGSPLAPGPMALSVIPTSRETSFHLLCSSQAFRVHIQWML